MSTTASLLFVTSFFEPFMISRATCQKIFQQIKQEGVSGILKNIAQIIKNHPTDTFIMLSSFALGCESLESRSLLIHTAVATVSTVRQSQTLVKFTQTLRCETILEKGLKLALYGSAIYGVCSVSAAAALEWNSVADAKMHYNGKGPCENQLRHDIGASAKCLSNGKGFDECRALIPEGASKDLYVFTHHPSGAVSIVQFGQKVCFLTALTPNSAATKTCFFDITNPGTRTVEALPDMQLSHAHRGLPTGHSVRHIALHKDQHGCGVFHEDTANEAIGDQPTCILTALTPGGDVTQTCYDPKNPTAMTLKKIEGIDLNFQDDGKPVSIVIKNPQLLGLNPYAKKGDDSCHCDPVDDDIQHFDRPKLI